MLDQIYTQPAIYMDAALDALCNFRSDANQDTFFDIFGQVIGYHLWDKFKNHHDYDVINFYRYLDGENAVKFADYVSIHYCRFQIMSPAVGIVSRRKVKSCLMKFYSNAHPKNALNVCF